MKTVYIDYNVVSSLFASNKEYERRAVAERLDLLRKHGHRFAFSAWHSFEIARSTSSSHIVSCCEFIESLDPVWMSNSSFVKKAELVNYQKYLKLIHGERGYINIKHYEYADYFNHDWRCALDSSKRLE